MDYICPTSPSGFKCLVINCFFNADNYVITNYMRNIVNDSIADNFTCFMRMYA